MNGQIVEKAAPKGSLNGLVFVKIKEMKI